MTSEVRKKPEPLFQPSCSVLPALFRSPQTPGVHSSEKLIPQVKTEPVENDMANTKTSPICLVENELCDKNASQLVNHRRDDCRNAVEHSKSDPPSHHSESPSRSRTPRMKRKKEPVQNIKGAGHSSDGIHDSNSSKSRIAVQDSTKSEKVKKWCSNGAGNIISSGLNQAPFAPMTPERESKKQQCSFDDGNKLKTISESLLFLDKAPHVARGECNLYNENRKTVPKVRNGDCKLKRPAEDAINRGHKMAKSPENVQKKPEANSHHLENSSILPNAGSLSCRATVPGKSESEPTGSWLGKLAEKKNIKQSIVPVIENPTTEDITLLECSSTSAARKMPELKNIQQSIVPVIENPTTDDIIFLEETSVNGSLQTERPNERRFENVHDSLPNELGEQNNQTAIFNDSLQNGSTLYEAIPESPISRSLKNLLHFVRLNSKVNKSEVPECLQRLNAKYPHIKKKCLDLFYDRSREFNKEPTKTPRLDVSDKNEIQSFETLETAVSNCVANQDLVTIFKNPEKIITEKRPDSVPPVLYGSKTCMNSETVSSSYPSIYEIFLSPEKQNVLNKVPFSSTDCIPSVSTISTHPRRKTNVSNSFWLDDEKTRKQIEQEIVVESVKRDDSKHRIFGCIGDTSTRGHSHAMANEPETSPSTTDEVEVIVIKTEPTSDLNKVPFSSTDCIPPESTISTHPHRKTNVSNSFLLADKKTPKQIEQEITVDSVKCDDSKRVCIGDASTRGLSHAMANEPDTSPSTTDEVKVIAIKSEPTSDPMMFALSKNVYSNQTFVNSSKNLQSPTVISPSPVPHPLAASSAKLSKGQPQFSSSSEGVLKKVISPSPDRHPQMVSVKSSEGQPQTTSSLESTISNQVISQSPDVPMVSSKPADSKTKFCSSPESANNPNTTPTNMKNTEVLSSGPDTSFSNPLPNPKGKRPYQPFVEASVYADNVAVQKRPRSNHTPVVFPCRRGNQTSSNCLHRNIGRGRVGISDLATLIIEWNPSWLQVQKKTGTCAPISDVYLRVKDTYENELEYYNTYFPLHLLNIWIKLSESWANDPVFFDCVFDSQEERPNSVKITCSTVLSLALFESWPRRDDVLVCTTTKPDGSQKGLFGRVCKVVVKDYAPPINSGGLQDRVGTLKMVTFDFFCAERLEVHHHDTVRIQILLNVRIALLQNGALQNMNQAMRDLIFDPRRHRSQARFIPLQFEDRSAFQNCIGDILDSATSPDIRATVVDTSAPCDLLFAMSHIAVGLVERDCPVLIGLRDLDSLVKLVGMLRLCNIVLAVKKEEVKLPDELKKFTIEERWPVMPPSGGTSENCPITLTLMSNTFMGDFRNRPTDQQLTCILHEAHLCTETETSLLLYYNVKHLVLMGKDEDSTALHSILKDFGYHVSLFSRLSRTG